MGFDGGFVGRVVGGTSVFPVAVEGLVGIV